MDKNSIIGFVLIGCILIGFTVFQNRESRKIAEQRRIEMIAAQAQADSLARLAAADSSLAALPREDAPKAASVYKDSLIGLAADAEAMVITIANDLLSLDITTRGAMPYAARVKSYRNYDQSDLYLFRDGKFNYDVSIYAGEFIRTSDFTFEIVSQTDSSVVMRLPFEGGACIEQSYFLPTGSYRVENSLAFVGMDRVIPRNVSTCDVDFGAVIPRMEKGFKNESQYSKLDYWFDGDAKPSELGRGRNGSKRIESKLSWFAFQQQFFSIIIDAPGQFASGELSVNFKSQDDPSNELMECKAAMRLDLEKSQRVELPFNMYLGPNHFQTLHKYDRKYEKIIPLGGWLVGWFTRYVIIPLFNFLNKYFANFGIIILIMTLVIKTAVLPFTNKSLLSAAKMSALKPEMEKINARYPKQEDAMKKQQATMNLYKRAGVSPMGGCLPTLITLPILWAMFRFFPASIELRQQPFLWCKDLSAYDSILDYGVRIPILGDHLSLFALLMAVTMWLYSKMTVAGQAAGNDPNAASMRFMTLWMMPVMMFFICNNLSAALSYYYLLSQLYSIVQNIIIRKYFVNPDEILAKVAAYEGKPIPKSKWQLRLEEAQRIQEAQMKQKGRK